MPGEGFAPALVRRLAVDLIHRLIDVVSDAGYGGHADGGMPLMVRTTATVMALMLREDGAVAAASANAALKAHGCKYRLVLMS